MARPQTAARPPNGWKGDGTSEGGGDPGGRGLDFGGRRGPGTVGRKTRGTETRGGRTRRTAAPTPSPLLPTRSDRADGPLRTPQLRPGGRPTEERPSDRRGPGRNPGPQGAFEVSMINVSCNSH